MHMLNLLFANISEENMANTELSTTAPTSSFKVSLPEKFDFNDEKSDAWPKWKKNFERFCKSTQLYIAPGEEQVNTLVYIMGEKVDDIFSSFNLSQEDEVDYEKVIAKFDKYFVPR